MLLVLKALDRSHLIVFNCWISTSVGNLVEGDFASRWQYSLWLKRTPADHVSIQLHSIICMVKGVLNQVNGTMGAQRRWRRRHWPVKFCSQAIYDSLPHVCLPAEWKGDRKAKESQVALSHGRIKGKQPSLGLSHWKKKSLPFNFSNLLFPYFFNKP